jgi:hypothetical protein
MTGCFSRGYSSQVSSVAQLGTAYRSDAGDKQNQKDRRQED